MLNKLSIRMRLTILTGSIILVTSLILTLTSIYNANDKFVIAAATTTPIYSIMDGSMSTVTESIPSTNSIPATVISPSTVLMKAKQAKKSFDLWSYIYLLFIAFFGMIAAYFIAGKALKPIHTLSTELENIEANNLSVHISSTNKTDEIGSLTTSFNAMLDRLENSFAMQKRFSADAAHELKTPLATIKTSIEVLNLDKNPTIEDYRENLEITQLSTNRLIKVVEGLLTLTSECREDFSNSIDLDELFTQILNELEPVYQKKNIKIDMNIGLKYLTGNQVLLYRAFFNLLENAMKYNKKDGHILITTKKEDSAITLSISDSGFGIPAEDLSLIFEPFYRVDKSRSRLIGGSGLGLSIVKTIIEKHNGVITVASELNVGSVFTISFS